MKGDFAEDKAASRFDAPKTVRVSASVPATGGGQLNFHFVNYNRDEPAKPKSPGAGIQDEKPIATPVIACDVRLPQGFRQPRVTVFTPESSKPTPIAAKFAEGRLRFEVPSFLVYSVVEVQSDQK